MAGRTERHEAFASDWVQPRTVDVWLPPGYDADADRRFPVLYMHDGQNLFEPELSFSGVPWAVDRAVDRLHREERLRRVIVVAIWNTAARIPEYMPERPMEEAPSRIRERFRSTYGDNPRSDDYLRFVVSELKPFVDERYRTLAGETYVMGSSMGGLVSLYALCEYPDVFTGAGCLSTSWTIGGRLMLRYLRDRLPKASRHRLYFDYGVEAQIAHYESLQKEMDRMLRAAGYVADRDWVTERFPGEPHAESAWRDRVDVPLRFLIGTRPGP